MQQKKNLIFSNAAKNAIKWFQNQFKNAGFIFEMLSDLEL